MITNSKSGIGGAHIGFSMLGARGPLCGPENDGAISAGSGVAPPVPTTAAPGDPVVPAPGAAPEKMLPQSQVNTLIAAEKRDTEAKTRARVLQEIKDQATVTSAPKPTPSSTAGMVSAADVAEMMARDRAFTRATATAGLNDRQMQRMETAMKADAPSDVAAWSAAYIEDLGIVKAPSTSTLPASHATPTATLTPEVPRPPSAAPSAPTGHGLPLQNGIVDLFSLEPTQLKALGPSGVRAALEALQKIGSQQAGMPQRPKPPSQR